jgi:transposase-like protein
MNKCPYCQAKSKQVKSGFNPSGSQRFLCKWCDRIYTPAPKPNGYSSEVRLEAIKLHEAGHSYRVIARKLCVGTQSVANWVHAGKEACEES